MNTRNKLEAFYLLMNTPPVFNIKTTLKILNCFESIEHFWQLKPLDISKLNLDDKIIEKLSFKLSKTTLDKLNEIIDSANTQIALFTDDCYPNNLKRYYSPPVMLFYKGDITTINNKFNFAIVGTRKASEYGSFLVQHFMKDINNNMFNIITGTAKGIDSLVLNNSITYHHKTIAVLSSGIDKISPQKSKELLNEITTIGGCYLTEFPPGTPSYKSNYDIRAKIIATISTYSLIIEAPNSSGALLVARESHKLNNFIFCPPSFFDDSNFAGSHQLIAEGKAILVRNFEDIKNYCGF